MSSCIIRPGIVLALAAAQSALAAHLEEVNVTGQRSRLALSGAALTVSAADSSELLRRVPGANVNRNGPLSGIPQYRGMHGARVHVAVNGLHISSGGPNWMDPPLHYAPTALLESLTVYRGIAPVSAGQETIGGAMQAHTWTGRFRDDQQWQAEGFALLGAQSANDSRTAALAASLANNRNRVYGSAVQEAGDDTEAARATLTPSEYERERQEIGYGHRAGAHSLDIRHSRNRTGDSGTPALPMDIEFVDGDHTVLKWVYEAALWQWTAQVDHGDIEHGMSNYQLRTAPADFARWRRTVSASDSTGALVSASYRSETFNFTGGFDYHGSEHEADIRNPNDPAFFAVNFSGAYREISGLFAEAGIALGSRWQLDAGVRVNRVVTDADAVDASMAASSPAVAALRDRFNSAHRRQHDTLVDAVLTLSHDFDGAIVHGGVARKHRAPAYQERYLWLPLQSTAGLADGRNHIGDIGLEPESATELELGVDWQTPRLQFSPRLFWKEVDDYIQGVPATDLAAQMVNTMTGGNPTLLQFANVSARLYGADVEYSLGLDEHWTLRGVASYIRGERRDIDDDLYRIAPPNITTGIDYRRSRWTASLEHVRYAAQHRVSATNGEQETRAYQLFNLIARLEVNPRITVDAGINNLLDENYADHLSGYNRALNSDLALGERLPGEGRNLLARVRVRW